MTFDSWNKEDLERGLAVLPGFLAEICYTCGGTGMYEQTYTAGCGMGYYRSMGRCERCKGILLLQDGKPASRSVINQILVAAKDSNKKEIVG